MTSTNTQDAGVARNALTKGLLASGISVNGLVAGNNARVAAEMFAKACAADPTMCDAWLARLAAGDDRVAVVEAAWNARATLGWETGWLGLLPGQLRPQVFDGLFLRLEITSVDALLVGYALALSREGRYARGDELLAGIAPTDRFDADMHTYARGLLYFRAQRWTDVQRLFPAAKPWCRPEYAAAAAAMVATALASLGVFEDAFNRAKPAIEGEHVPAAATVALYTQAMCLRHLDRENEAAQLLRRVYSRDPNLEEARIALEDPTYRLTLSTPESIEGRSDPWDPATAPAASAKADAEAARYLAEGDAELGAMLGMEPAKREIRRIKSTTKANLARQKMGLPVPVTSRHTLLLGPPGTGKTTVARAFTKQLCGLGVLRTPSVVETSRAKLLGRYMADAEKNTEEMLEQALGGAVFFDEMHNLYESGYSQGDAYGNAIINTLLLYMENHRDELAVFGAGYPKATQRMLEVNQGLRRRFPTVIEFFSYTPTELIDLTHLMAREDKDIISADAVDVLRPSYVRYYSDERLSADGDLIRGIDLLGNAGFVRNVVEKAREHRNHRLDMSGDLDELLAADVDSLDERRVNLLRELTAEDLGEGLQAAVTRSDEDS